ncbi:MFS transporter [Streptomyces sp. NPDC051064]|uniref:MFS transporter n=1 Tax=Streptomyces sp. NPDC051064 TaxID=3365641 RepID=UPI00379D81E4
MARNASLRAAGKPRRSLFVCLVLVTALGALDQTVVATALPAIVTDLGTPWRASWIVTAYVLTLTAAMPAVGALGDRFGRRLVLVAAIAVFVAASAACGVAGGVESLAAARLAQGIGGAGLLTLPQAVVADAVPARERAAYLGPLGAVFSVATVVSPLLGGWLTDAASWRWIFWLNLPLGVAATALVLAAVPAAASRRGRGRTFDTVGAGLLAAASAGLVLVTLAVAESGWTARTCAAALATALLATIAVRWEHRVADPVLPVRILARRPVSLCCLLALVGGIGLFGVLAYVPTWIQGAYATSATTAGLMLLPVTAGIVVGMNGSGRAVRRRGHWRPYPIAGCALSALATATLAVFSRGTLPLPLVAALLAQLGLGTGLFMQVVVVVAQDASDRTATGAVTAGMAFTREIGVLAGGAALGAVAGHALTADHAAYGAAFTTVFATAAACFACGLAVALRMPAHTLASARTS